MTSNTLKQALSLIETPDTWCKRDRAQDKAGKPVPVMSKAAVKFCSRGALYRAMGSESADISDLERFFTMKGNAGNPLALNYIGVNELRPHAAVLDMWREAVRLAEKEEAEGGPKSPKQLVEEFFRSV